MTVDEFLLQNKEVLKTMAVNGISLDLGRCAGMLQVYEDAKKEHGHRFACNICKEKFSLLTDATVYRIIRELKRLI